MERLPVLLIEDKKENSDLISNVLKQHGYTTWVSPTIEEGLEMLKQRSFAIVLTEIKISSLASRQIVKKIKATDPSVAIVAITPYNLISDAIDMMEEGAFGYITKPFNPSEMRIVMEHAMEQYRLKREAGQKSYYHQLSLVDGLTGLYNHRYLYDVLGEEMHKVRQHPQHISILMFDIDNFKKYNDTNGHQAGDQLLKDLSNLVNTSLRGNDMSFRYGGEEFVVFLPHTQKQNAALVAERILNLARLHLPTTISIGVAGFPEDGDNTDELIAKADQALYKAKAAGKDQVCMA
ncbi:MAG: diguanylate cyclase [Candidatus Omnitrophota bacterium]|jgi:diguanylate cyclase (GGDEF)-like protein